MEVSFKKDFSHCVAEVERSNNDPEAFVEMVVKMKDLSYLMLRQGKLVEAEFLARDVARFLQHVLGRSADATSIAKRFHCKTLFRLNMLEEAECVGRETVEDRPFDADPDALSLRAVTLLAQVLMARGKSIEASSLLHKSVLCHDNVLPADHPEMRWAFSLGAKILLDQGDVCEAEHALRKLRRMKPDSEEPISKRKLDLLVSETNLALTRYKLGKETFSNFESLLQEVVKRLSKDYGENHPWHCEYIGYLGQFLAGEGRFTEAESYLREALAGNRRCLGDSHPQTLSALRSIVLVASAQKLDALKAQGEAGRKSCEALAVKMWNSPYLWQKHSEASP